MGLILDSSAVIAAERLGQTAYQMLETIGLQTYDPQIAHLGDNRAGVGSWCDPGESLHANARHFELIPGLGVQKF